MTTCRSCGSARLVSKGTRTCTVRTLEDGRGVERPVPVRRVLCKDCGAMGQDTAAMEAEVRRFLDEAGAVAVRLGVSGAAEAIGIDRKQVRAALAAWIARREDDLPERLPGRLVVARPMLAGRTRLVLADADADCLVDMLPDASPGDLESWLVRRRDADAPVVTVIGPLDPTLSAAVAAGLPGSSYAVAPSEAQPVLDRWAAMLTRSPRALERHGRLLGKARESGVLRHMDQISELAIALDEPTVIGQVTLWRGAVRAGAGVGGTFLDARLRGLAGIAPGWRRASFARLRARILMDEGPRVFSRTAMGATVSLGVPVAHAERILREDDAGDDSLAETDGLERCA